MDIAIIISGVAALASLYSLYHTIQTRKDAARAQAIGDFYSTFYEFDKLHLQNWQLSHLFVVPSQYHDIVRKVARRKSYSNDERTELLLKEKAVARFIFDTFENTLYQYRQAKDAKDTGRSRFLEEVLQFQTNKILRNPRLLHLWRLEIENYEPVTIDYYEKHVIKDPENPLTNPADPKGPFIYRK